MNRKPLPKLFWVFWWGSIINRLGNLVVPFLTFYLTRDRGFSAGTAGLFVAIWGLGAALAGVVGGTLADRWGRRPTALLGLTGGAMMILTLSVVRGGTATAITVFLLGLITDLFRPAISAAIADVVPPEDRARAFGLQYWAVNLGFAIAALSGGFLAQFGYQTLFIVDAATTLIYVVILASLMPETRPSVARAVGMAEPGSPLSGGFSRVLADRVFVVFLLLCLAVGLIFMQSSATMAGDMGARGFGESDYGLVMALNGVLIVALQPAVTALITRPVPGAVGPRFDPSHVLALAALLTGLGFGFYAFGSLATYALGVIVWTSGEIIMAPINASVVAALAPVHLRGRYQGAFTMSHGAAACLGPLLGTRLIDHLGPLPVWLGCAVLGAVAAVGYMRLAPALASRVAVG